MLFIPYRGRSFANGYAKVRWQGSHYPEGYKRYPNGLGLRGAKPSTYDRKAERMFDGLGIGMRGFEFLRRAFDVGTEVFELGSHLLLERELLHVNSVVRVGGDRRVGVLLPCERLGSCDDDPETVVLNRAGEIGRLALLFDERLHSGFHLRTERFQRCFGFITCYLRSEKLVNHFKIGCHNGSALFQLVPCEWVKRC